MTDDLEVPMEIFSSIPDDADEGTKLYMRAQTVIQSAFYSLGNGEISSGQATMGYAELEQILSAALAMLVAGDASLETRRDVRFRIEEHAKYMRGFADILKESQDTQAIQILDMLRLRQSGVN